MKTLATLAAAASMALIAGIAQAQTCAATAGSISDGSGTIVVDTCAFTNQLLSACNGLDAIGSSPDTIFSLSLPPGVQPTGGIHAAPTGYDLKLALLENCAGGATCIRDADAAGIGGAEHFSFVGIVGPQNLFVLLTSFGGTPDCGSTAVSVLPPIPVVLQRFSVD